METNLLPTQKKSQIKIKKVTPEKNKTWKVNKKKAHRIINLFKVFIFSKKDVTGEHEIVSFNQGRNSNPQKSGK